MKQIKRYLCPIIALCTFCGVLAGCASSNGDVATVNANYITADSAPIKSVDLNAQSQLAQAAQSINQSLQQLANTQSSIYQQRSLNNPQHAQKAGLIQQMSIAWNGPIEPLVNKIARSCNYKFKVLGNQPNIPLMITLNANQVPAAKILYDIQLQTNNQASVAVYPASHTIELRYNSNALPSSVGSKAAPPIKHMSQPRNAQQLGMSQLTSMQWTGPIQPPLQKLAHAAHYSFRVINKGNNTSPVIVSLNAQNNSLAEIIRNIQYQAGSQAQISIDPVKRSLTLNYLKSN